MNIGILNIQGKLSPLAKTSEDAVLKELSALGHSSYSLSDDAASKGRLCTKPPELLFNLMDGYKTRNQAAQVVILCEALGIAFTGSDGISLALACDKHLAKVVAAAGGAPIAEGEVIRQLGDLDDLLLPLPLFCKPLYGSKGFAISADSLIRDESELYSKVGRMLNDAGQAVIVEEFLAGREFTIGLWGGKDPEVIGIMECAWAEKRKQPFIFSFRDYAREPERIKFNCPAEIDTDLATDIANIARIAWQALGCRGYATVDIRLNDEGTPHFLELDAVPNLHPERGKLPFIASRTGIKYGELIGGIIELATKRPLE
jgi:D-alanine-D-alanine ligase